MANKRMFSLSVVDTDKFLEMPLSSRLLYYELGMRADDDGFVGNWKKILLFTGLKEDDMKVLIAKNFIIPFESGVIVIKHWRMNNYLQNDRIKPTIYRDELEQLEIENGVYILNKNEFNTITFENENITAKEKRKIAYQESELPYSFDYKIKKEFTNEKCPICGYEMANYVNAPHRPTIQHNIPLSKGGKHELGNISIICHKCNVSIQDKETGELNSKEVIEKWDKLQECIQGCIHSIDKYSIDKYSIDKYSIDKNSIEYKKSSVDNTLLNEIVEYLNQKANTKYKSTTNKTKTLINARFNEGFTKEDFIKVIDNKTEEWLNDGKMCKFLRPETLFGTKFESYLNQKNTKEKQPEWHFEIDQDGFNRRVLS